MGYDGDTLRKARILAGLTQDQLGHRIAQRLGKTGGSGKSVNRWERVGLTDRSPYVAAMEAELQLSAPNVLRAIEQMGSPSEPAVRPIPDIDPTDIPDGALLALIDRLMAEWKRRFWERGAAAPVRLHGQTVPYPHHLDETVDTPRTRRTTSE